jgi:hypothetical protein
MDTGTAVPWCHVWDTCVCVCGGGGGVVHVFSDQRFRRCYCCCAGDEKRFKFMLARLRFVVVPLIIYTVPLAFRCCLQTRCTTDGVMLWASRDIPAQILAAVPVPCPSPLS